MSVLFPFGAAAQTVTLTAGGAQAVTINNMFLFIDGLTTASTAARTINLTIGSGVRIGAVIVVSTKSANATTGNRDLIFGTGITADKITPAQNKDAYQAFFYDGTGFVPMGAHYVAT